MATYYCYYNYESSATINGCSSSCCYNDAIVATVYGGSSFRLQTELKYPSKINVVLLKGIT